MENAAENSGLLSGCRALDLTNENGFLCGKILSDLGVDVVKVEPPGGDPARRIGPFWHDIPDLEKSLYWFAYNSNKRGITLNLETADGRDIFKSLVKKSDFVIESFRPGSMENMGLGYDVLTSLNEGIILTSITPFGQSGPYRDYEGPDLVVMGMSGELYLTGDADRPPVNISIPQACLHAGADAGVGSMIAYYHKHRTGKGQHVDVSMQQSTAWFLAMAIPYYEMAGVMMSRVGTFRSGSASGTVQRQVWPCKDGYVFFFMLGGAQGAKTCRALVKWMNDLGLSNEFLNAYEWEQFDMASATQDLIDRISAPIEEFFRTRTKKEVLEAAMARNISVCPLFSMQDEANDPHLAYRGYWKEITHPELDVSITYPKQFVRSSEKEIATRFRAPLIGEHNREIYEELGFSPIKLAALKQAGVI
ncbi:MAG TPA: CoA transferase [Syntrophorhabdaceae bacterium]|nr:CoA transferase [Syntrophorhabdaceae bacterium]